MEKISPPVRILLVVLVLVGLGGMLALRTLGPSPDDGSVAAPVLAKSSTATSAKPGATAAKPAAKAAPKPAASKAAAAKPKSAKPAKPVATPAAAKPAAAPEAPKSGFPAAVDAALAKHEVVVVSLVVPGARVDELAAAEAKAGAEAGGVGFLALNVLNEEVAHALLTKLGEVHDPTLLVLKRPGVVALKVPGFVDRDTVAQAAANASS